MRAALAALAVASMFLAPRPAAAEGPASPASPSGMLKVREVSVFKDGHAYLVRHGKVPVGPDGDVVLENLPRPLLGTFWPFVPGDRARLAAVVAGKRRILQRRPADDLGELLAANPGAEVWIREAGKEPWVGTVQSVTLPPDRPAAAISPAVSRTSALPPIAAPAATVLVRTGDTTRLVPVAAVETVVFRGDPRREVEGEEERDALSLRLDWKGKAPDAEAEVGMGTVERGIRWIPSYRVEIDGAGKAQVRLHATLVNDLDDLEDVTLHLVVGVPSFDFKGTLDPLALPRDLAPLSAWFQTDPGSLTGGALASNVVVSQQYARSSEFRRRDESQEGPAPEALGSASEDLHVYTLRGITLKKGERMQAPVSEATMAYRDVHALDLPVSPPAELRGAATDARSREILRLMLSPKAVHRLRLENRTSDPLTTAPALVLKEGRVLGQGTMTYAPPGASVDLKVTAAVDLKVARCDEETGRAPNALRIDGNSFARVDLKGSITITNPRATAVTVEVSRWVPGAVNSCDHGGKATAVDPRGEEGWLASGDVPWGTWNWPNWWSAVNGATEIRWAVTVEPGKTETLAYGWHYFWR